LQRKDGWRKHSCTLAPHIDLGNIALNWKTATIEPSFRKLLSLPPTTPTLVGLIIYLEQNNIGFRGIKIMLIPVIYRDNEMGLIEASRLNELISSNNIKKFLRSEGWVTISMGRIRRSSRHKYLGRERRRTSK
jgi:hypothetical protein